MEGPTGLTGMAGNQGLGFRGPTGNIGPNGIPRTNSTDVTGPRGPRGAAGISGARPGGSTHTITAYATGSTGTSAPSLDSTSTILWSAPIPTSIRGKHGILSVYFDMTTNWVVPPTTQFDYGLYVDNVPLARGPNPLQRYVQSTANTNLIAIEGDRLGEFGATPITPLTLPIALNSNAANLQIQAANASTILDSFMVSPTRTSLTTIGSNAFTSPVGSIGVLAYVWGCGGASFGSNAGGPGGFSFGYIPAAAGTVFTAIVGGLGTNTFLSGFGGPGFSGTSGAGGGFSGVFLGASPASNSSVPLVVAGGGGGCFVGVAGSNFMFVGGGGGGLFGASSLNISNQLISSSPGSGGLGAGGTQTGAGFNAAQWRGAGYNNGNGAGGGGYFGGGTGNNANQGIGGGGGSGFIGGTVERSYMPLALTSTNVMTAGTTSNVTVPSSDIMSNFGVSPLTFGHGNGGTGVIVLIPVLSRNSAPFVNVDARFSTA